MKIAELITPLLLAGFLSAPLPAEPQPTSVRHAPWSEKAVIYELNTRQFTPQGSFKAIMGHIPALKKLGVTVVWFMPIHPIGQKNRKGSLGSPYAISDYYGVNPEFGDLQDFKALVAALHEAGMCVLIDLVANHTAWDSVLADSHPDWYAHDPSGRFVSPHDWSDVIKLDYSRPELREYMISMLEYWVREVGIDGFRCDVAADVPTSFWNEARARLDTIRPVFMLAEAEKPELLEKAFDCDYASELFRVFDRIPRGQAKASEVDALVRRDLERYPQGSWRMRFATNHDQNTWLDSDVNRLGPEGSLAFAWLTFTLPGLPLIYNGQEVGDPHKLEFFEKDCIRWKDSPRRQLFERMAELRRRLPALSAGSYVSLANNRPDQVLSFQRELKNSLVVVVANLSPQETEVTVQTGRTDLSRLLPGPPLKPGNPLRLRPWQVELLTP